MFRVGGMPPPPPPQEILTFSEIASGAISLVESKLAVCLAPSSTH